MNETNPQQAVGAPLERQVRPCPHEPMCGCGEAEQPCAKKRDVVGLLRNLERQSEDNIWRTAKEAREEIEALRQRIGRAEHWATHAMLMRSTQNAELLRILGGCEA